MNYNEKTKEALAKELESLQAHFSELEGIKEKLKESRSELEIRVKVRTAELTKLNEELQKTIREQKHTEELLRKSQEELQSKEQFLSNIFSSIQDGISILDKDMNIVKVNPAMEKWYKHAMPLVGKKCYEAYQSRKNPCEICPTQKTLKTGEVAREIIPYRDKKGAIIGWFILFSFPIYDIKTGKLSGVIEYVRDITEQKKVQDRLQDSEMQLRSVIDAMADGIHVVDSELCIVIMNNRFKDWIRDLKLSSDKELMLGKSLFDVFPFLKNNVKEEYEKVFKTGQVLITEEVNKFGKEQIFTETRKIPVFENGKVAMVLTIVRDITVRKKAELDKEKLNEELIKSNKKLGQLNLIDSQTGIYNHHYVTDIIEAEFHRAKRFVHVFSIIMLDIDYFRSINNVYGHQFGDLILRQLARQLKGMVRRYDTVARFGGEEFIIICPNIDRKQGIVLAQRILDALNLYNFGNKEHNIKLKLSLGVASYPEDKIIRGIGLVDLGYQILSQAKQEGGNRVFSSLDLEKKKGHVATKENNGKNANIKSLRLKIEKLTKKANENLVESIFALAKTIELKDHYTGEHVERTVYYAVEIAKALGLPYEEIELIREASMLHDLGKIGISDKILLKKGKLTMKEYEEIKKHPQIGTDIIRPIHSLQGLIPLIFYHHERWDGKGYPIGIKADEIPLGARIIAVADAYQALVSDRPYRKAFSKEKATAIIKDASGTQYDPLVVSEFIKILRREG